MPEICSALGTNYLASPFLKRLGRFLLVALDKSAALRFLNQVQGKPQIFQSDALGRRY